MPAPIRLELDDDEARITHHALAVATELLDVVDPPPGALLRRADRDALITVARRLDHERRHRGAVPNPN